MNDVYSSIKVGTKTQVELFEHFNYGGRSIKFS